MFGVKCKFCCIMILGVLNENFLNNEWFEYDDNLFF